MRSLPLLLLTLALSLKAAQADNSATNPDLSVYPQDPAVQHCLGTHQAKLHLQFNSLLLITECINTGGALEYYVTETGAERDSREVYHFAQEATHQRRLTDAELADLRAAIQELPAENVLPPLERLVIVSFRDGADWVTRSYDRHALPKPMRHIYDIIGERGETKR